MNFNGSRLGFWFNSQNRASKSTRVLVFYDPYTYVYVPSDEYIYTNFYSFGGPGAPTPNTEIWPIIEAREIAAGFQPELVIGYDNLPEDLSVYAHIWDIGYVSSYAGNPTFDPTNKIVSYIQGGGALFFLGENKSLNQGPVEPTRWGTIINVLDLLGETVSMSANQYYQVTSIIKPQFLIANNNNIFSIGWPGSYGAIGGGTIGGGTYMTEPGDPGAPAYSSVMWTTGTLSNAPLGAIISVLDVNFVTAEYAQYDYIDNIIASLNQR